MKESISEAIDQTPRQKGKSNHRLITFKRQ